MKSILTPLLSLLLACTVNLVERESARAISREQDTVRDVTNLFRAPTVLPPNNAIRPSINNTLNGRTVVEPFQRDDGPGENDMAERVAVGYYPFVVALVENDKPPLEGFICAGVIVAPNWALTAAHCTYNWVRRWPNDANPYVLTETAALVSPGQRYAVTKIVPHPDYNARRLINDVALVRFEANGAKAGPPVRLEGPPIQEQVGRIAQVVGWGVSNIRLSERQQLETLQMIQLSTLGDAFCFSSVNYPRLKGKNVFCAQSLLKFHDTCYRFGGAPVIMRDSKRQRYLAGLVAWPASCPSEFRKPSVYLDVQPYVPWIRATIKENSQDER